MLSLTTVAQAQEKIAENARLQRLAMGLTQQGLAERSGVALPTLRKFEQKGLISLESFLKLQMVLGGLEKIVKSIEPNIAEFSSIDEVIKANKKPTRKRGNRR
jgi:transcriptional regulator with XRE-family HTH domain